MESLGRSNRPPAAATLPGSQARAAVRRTHQCAPNAAVPHVGWKAVHRRFAWRLTDGWQPAVEDGLRAGGGVSHFVEAKVEPSNRVCALASHAPQQQRVGVRVELLVANGLLHPRDLQ